MKKTARRDDRTSRRDAQRPAPRAWTKPDFVEVSACAEIGAYVFTA